MSWCKCSNIFEPIKLKPRKEPLPPNPIFNEIYLTKEAKYSLDQSSKYIEKASINNNDNNFYIDYKNGSSFQYELPRPKFPSMVLHGTIDKSREKPIRMERERENTGSQRSIEGNNTPHVQIHEIKRIENEREISMNFENFVLRKFNRDAFMEMFKNPQRKLSKKLEDIAP